MAEKRRTEGEGAAAGLPHHARILIGRQNYHLGVRLEAYGLSRLDSVHPGVRQAEVHQNHIRILFPGQLQSQAGRLGCPDHFHSRFPKRLLNQETEVRIIFHYQYLYFFPLHGVS